MRDENGVFEGIILGKMREAFKESDSKAIDEFRNGISMEKLRLNRSRRFLEKSMCAKISPKHSKKNFIEYIPLYRWKKSWAGERKEDLHRGKSFKPDNKSWRNKKGERILRGAKAENVQTVDRSR